MADHPSWLDPSVSTTPSATSGSQTKNPYESYKPDWLSDDVQGTMGTVSPTGDLQLVAVQSDGVPVVPMTPTANETATPATGAQAARRKTWGQFCNEAFRRDGRTILIAIVVIICMNIPYLKYVIYPFTIFSTWIHESCHGYAALMVGGKIDKIQVFPDTSGLTTFSLPAGNKHSAFIASAGYQGTAVIGMLLLMLRRTKRGPRGGTMLIAFFILLSVCLWVRNAFAVALLLVEAILLAIAAWWLPSFWMRNLYVLLAVTTALNAISAIRSLFGKNQQVNGKPIISDASVMAQLKGGSHTMWALIWFFLAIILAMLGMVFCIPGPDEAADFTICGMCKDMGCFYICNAKGRRLWRTLLGRNQNDDDKTEKEKAPEAMSDPTV